MSSKEIYNSMVGAVIPETAGTGTIVQIPIEPKMLNESEVHNSSNVKNS
jgi:hypothetical protein